MHPLGVWWVENRRLPSVVLATVVCVGWTRVERAQIWAARSGCDRGGGHWLDLCNRSQSLVVCFFGTHEIDRLLSHSHPPTKPQRMVAGVALVGYKATNEPTDLVTIGCHRVQRQQTSQRCAWLARTTGASWVGSSGRRWTKLMTGSSTWYVRPLGPTHQGKVSF